MKKRTFTLLYRMRCIASVSTNFNKWVRCESAHIQSKSTLKPLDLKIFFFIILESFHSSSSQHTQEICYEYFSYHFSVCIQPEKKKTESIQYDMKHMNSNVVRCMFCIFIRFYSNEKYVKLTIRSSVAIISQKCTIVSTYSHTILDNREANP